MTELSPRARSLLAQAKAASTPSAEDAAIVLAGITALTPTASAAVTTAAVAKGTALSTTLKLSLAFAVAAGAGVATTRVVLKELRSRGSPSAVSGRGASPGSVVASARSGAARESAGAEFAEAPRESGAELGREEVLPASGTTALSGAARESVAEAARSGARQELPAPASPAQVAAPAESAAETARSGTPQEVLSVASPQAGAPRESAAHTGHGARAGLLAPAASAQAGPREPAESARSGARQEVLPAQAGAPRESARAGARQEVLPAQAGAPRESARSGARQDVLSGQAGPRESAAESARSGVQQEVPPAPASPQAGSPRESAADTGRPDARAVLLTPVASAQAGAPRESRSGPRQVLPEPVVTRSGGPRAEGSRADAATTAGDALASTGASSEDRCALNAELVQVRRAQALLATRPGETVHLLEAWDRECPRGALVEERLALRALALCAQTDRAAGHATLLQLRARFPTSPALERVERACAQP